MKIEIKISACLILVIIGCSTSPNISQTKQTLANLDCYKQLADEIANGKELQKSMIQIRDAKKRGNFDPIWVDQEYRLIEIEEMLSLLDTNWISNCKKKLEEKNDLRGIRFIAKDLIIIELDVLDRYTLIESFSYDNTQEFHRLIFGPRNMERTEFYFGTEYILWQDTLSDNLVYEVTQIKKMH